MSRNIALIAQMSFQAQVFLKEVEKSGHAIERFVNCDDFLRAHGDFDLVFIVDNLFVASHDWQAQEWVTIGIDVDKGKQDRYDLCVDFPIDWQEICQTLEIPPNNAEIPPIFDNKVARDALRLLGNEAYAQALQDLLAEVDMLIEDLPRAALDKQIQLIHKTSGVAAVLGLLPLHETLLGMEDDARIGETEAYKTKWRGFASDWSGERAHMQEALKLL